MSLHESIGKNMRVKELLKCLWCDTVPNLHTLFKSMCKFKDIGSTSMYTCSKQKCTPTESVLSVRCMLQETLCGLAGENVQMLKASIPLQIFQQCHAMNEYSLVPRPPPFFVLRFSFSIIHGNGRARKTGKAWENLSRE